MKKIFEIALGILAAIGGFVDIGDIVFNVAAGAMFGYDLLWVVVIGVVGIIVYSEMCGRVAVVSQRAAFEAAVLFGRTEGIVPAPEPSHAIRVAIDEALAKPTGVDTPSVRATMTARTRRRSTSCPRCCGSPGR
jgi:hypothetical protein